MTSGAAGGSHDGSLPGGASPTGLLGPRSVRNSRRVGESSGGIARVTGWRIGGPCRTSWRRGPRSPPSAAAVTETGAILGAAGMAAAAGRASQPTTQRPFSSIGGLRSWATAAVRRGGCDGTCDAATASPHRRSAKATPPDLVSGRPNVTFRPPGPGPEISPENRQNLAVRPFWSGRGGYNVGRECSPRLAAESERWSRSSLPISASRCS